MNLDFYDSSDYFDTEKTIEIKVDIIPKTIDLKNVKVLICIFCKQEQYNSKDDYYCNNETQNIHKWKECKQCNDCSKCLFVNESNFNNNYNSCLHTKRKDKCMICR